MKKRKFMIGFFQRNKKNKETKKMLNPDSYAKGPETIDPLNNENMKEPPVVEITPRDTQQIIRGTKRQFSERITYNLSLLAQMLPSSDLVFEQFLIGSLSKRKVVIAYLKNRANPNIVSEIKERLKSIKTETIIDSSYVERYIENSRMSPFPQIETTLQPNAAEAALVQGRITIFTDGSPDVLIAPTTFFDLMDTTEDYFTRWTVAAVFFRMARLIMFVLAASLPGFYIAVTSFNPELIFTKLAFLIAGSRVGTPFPVYFEAFAMMGVVEAVRMMIIRIPSVVGGTIALFSGLTLVGAGLYANIIGAPITIIVTLTMISSFAIPNLELRRSVRIIQFITMIFSSILGVFGYGIAFFYFCIHLATLKSFGIPYMTPLAPVEGSSWSHIILRKDITTLPQDETYKPQSKKTSAAGDKL